MSSETKLKSSLMQKIRRKLGKPEVSILVIGDDNPATRNMLRIINTYIPETEFILDSSLHELPVTARFKLKPKLFDPFEGIFYLIDAAREDMIKHERIFFWEKLMWDSASTDLPIVICAYNSNLQGSLTRGELIENLSLIRVTDRNWQLFEIPDTSELRKDATQLLEAMDWLRKVIWMGWTKDWEIKEELQLKLAKKRVEILADEEESEDVQDSQ